MLYFNWHASFSHFCPCYKKQLYILPTFLPTPTVLVALFFIAVAPATSLPVNQACDADVIIIYARLLARLCQILQVILHNIFKKPPFLSVYISHACSVPCSVMPQLLHLSIWPPGINPSNATCLVSFLQSLMVSLLTDSTNLSYSIQVFTHSSLSAQNASSSLRILRILPLRNDFQSLHFLVMTQKMVYLLVWQDDC